MRGRPFTRYAKPNNKVMSVDLPKIPYGKTIEFSSMGQYGKMTRTREGNYILKIAVGTRSMYKALYFEKKYGNGKHYYVASHGGYTAYLNESGPRSMYLTVTEDYQVKTWAKGREAW